MADDKVNGSNMPNMPKNGKAIALLVVAFIVSAACSIKLYNDGYTGVFGVILLSILGTAGAAAGGWLGNLFCKAFRPDYVLTSGVGGMVKAKLFWFCGPQLIGFFLGMFLCMGMVDKFVKKHPSPEEQHPPVAMSQTYDNSSYTDTNKNSSQAAKAENEDEASGMSETEFADDSWPGEEATSSREEADVVRGRVIGTNVRLRSEPSLDGKQLALLSNVDVTVFKNKRVQRDGHVWYYVDTGKGSGWMSGQFLACE
ncbi:MAG: SH3 domain-containing protein [Synergistes sp.]|nr:SH3 domain-containing protein [Synergistes sp.]